jgi:hypothetical protein
MNRKVELHAELMANLLKANGAGRQVEHPQAISNVVAISLWLFALVIGLAVLTIVTQFS